MFKQAETQAVFEQLPEPKHIWRHFLQIVETPNGSGNMGPIQAHVHNLVREWNAQGKNLEIVQDATGNILIRKPASPGFEDRPSVCLQGHLDMVCEKNPGVEIDFETQPLTPRIVDDKLMATGTSLGADNGIGAALALAVIEDENAKTGPLEILLTIDEETSMVGAQNLEPDFLRSKRLINLDSEEDWRICIGCAGSFDTITSLPIEREAAGAGHTLVTLEFGGLQGGHSGMEIDRNRGNAIKLMGRLLVQAGKGTVLRLAGLTGGSKNNVIPSVCSACVAVPTAELAAFEASVARVFGVVQKEHTTAEAEFHLKPLVTAACSNDASVLTAHATQRCLDLLMATLHGVLRMSPDVPRLVQTSTNCATVALEDAAMKLRHKSRSNSNTEPKYVHDQLIALARLAGAECSEMMGPYPAWAPNVSSPLLAIATTAFREVMGKEPEIYAMHAGLECGMFQSKYTDLDCISIGPYLIEVHTPKETLFYRGVPKVYELLCAILASVH